MKRLLLTALAALLTAAVSPLLAAPQCAHGNASAPAVEHLRELLAQVRFVTYEPTSLQVVWGRVHAADPSSMRADLSALRRHFDALITYDAIHGAEEIPALAQALGFRAVILGVWNPLDPTELAMAQAAARRYPKLIAGLSLGNETIFSRRADATRLATAIASVRAANPQLPLSTTEPFHIFENAAGAPLLPQLDFMLVNVHPVFQPWFHGADEATAAQFVVNVTGQLAALYCGPILVKETGEPTAPAAMGYTPARQASFYRELRARMPPAPGRAFAYFAAFDAPWREQDVTGAPVEGPHPEEAYWGLYDAARRPKVAIDQLPPLAQDRPTRNSN